MTQATDRSDYSIQVKFESKCKLSWTIFQFAYVQAASCREDISQNGNEIVHSKQLLAGRIGCRFAQCSSAQVQKGDAACRKHGKETERKQERDFAKAAQQQLLQRMLCHNGMRNKVGDCMEASRSDKSSMCTEMLCLLIPACTCNSNYFQKRSIACHLHTLDWLSSCGMCAKLSNPLSAENLIECCNIRWTSACFTTAATWTATSRTHSFIPINRSSRWHLLQLIMVAWTSWPA